MSKFVITGEVDLYGRNYFCYLADKDGLAWEQSGEFLEFDSVNEAVSFIKKNSEKIKELGKLISNRCYVEEICYEQRFILTLD